MSGGENQEGVRCVKTRAISGQRLTYSRQLRHLKAWCLSAEQTFA
jgi:hypothetical protein